MGPLMPTPPLSHKQLFRPHLQANDVGFPVQHLGDEQRSPVAPWDAVAWHIPVWYKRCKDQWNVPRWGKCLETLHGTNTANNEACNPLVKPVCILVRVDIREDVVGHAGESPCRSLMIVSRERIYGRLGSVIVLEDAGFVYTLMRSGTLNARICRRSDPMSIGEVTLRHGTSYVQS